MTCIARTFGAPVNVPAGKVARNTSMKFKPGFARMRVSCGTTELTPIHPLLIERRISEREAVYEGLYAFDPGAISAACGEVRLDVFSEKAPAVAETVTVPTSVLDRVWRDFAAFRALK